MSDSSNPTRPVAVPLRRARLPSYSVAVNVTVGPAYDTLPWTKKRAPNLRARSRASSFESGAVPVCATTRPKDRTSITRSTGRKRETKYSGSCVAG